MKRLYGRMIIGGLVCMAAVAPVRAGDFDQVLLRETNCATNDAGTTVSDKLVGELDSVIIAVNGGATTVDVSVVTADGLTLFAKDSCTGTNYYRVRYPYHTAGGVAMTTTNAKQVVVSTVTANFNGASVTGITATAKLNYQKK